MRPNTKSNNYNILKNLLSKSRRYNLPDEINYIIIYTFLYKYCSDSLKEHFLLTLQDKELTLDEAYNDPHYQEIFRQDALQLFGFHIEKTEAFMDEIINNNYSDNFFLTDYFRVFPKNITFQEGSNQEKYFAFIFKTLKQNIQFNILEFDSEMSLAIKEIIFSISKLDIYESQFSFPNVFEILSASRLMHTNSNRDHISQILSSLISCENTSFKKAYDPFLMDGLCLMSLAQQSESGVTYYGKETSELEYCFTIVKFIINYFNLDYVEFKNEDAMESVDIDGSSFDVILSRIPIKIRNYYSSNEQQTFEMAKRSKRSELEAMLLKNFNMTKESFDQDSELNNALENLLEKMDVENDSDLEFVGEYESLKDNEFLFLINLIDSLEDDGIMAISISQNFLFKNSLETLRKYLTFEKNYIDTIISLPDSLSRRRSEVIMVFRKNKSNQDILFIDLSKNYKTDKSNMLFPGLFRRNLILAEETITKLQEIFTDRLSIDKLSNLIKIEEIIQNKFNLSVSRYVDTFEGEFITLNELVNEKKEIDSNIDELNSKIEKMMDELDITFK